MPVAAVKPSSKPFDNANESYVSRVSATPVDATEATGCGGTTRDVTGLWVVGVAESCGKVMPGITEPFAAVIDGAFAADGAGPVTEVAIGAEVVDDAVVFVEAGFVAPLSMIFPNVGASSAPTAEAGGDPRVVLGARSLRCRLF